MVRGLVMATAAVLMAVTSADAGLFFRSSGSCGGCAAPAPVVVSGCGSSSCDSCGTTRRVKFKKRKHSCCEPVAPSCCAPAAPVCAPACAAPAPSCCAPVATCCAPAPTCAAPVAPACGACAPATVVVPATGAGAGAPPPPMDGAVGEAPKPMAVDTPAPPK